MSAMLTGTEPSEANMALLKAEMAGGVGGVSDEKRRVRTGGRRGGDRGGLVVFSMTRMKKNTQILTLPRRTSKT